MSGSQMFMFKPVLIGFLNIIKIINTWKLVHVGVWKFWKIFRWGMKIWREIWMGYEFFGEKVIFPSAPVLGINNDQSLSYIYEIWNFVPSTSRLSWLANNLLIINFLWTSCVIKIIKMQMNQVCRVLKSIPSGTQLKFITVHSVV